MTTLRQEVRRRPFFFLLLAATFPIITWATYQDLKPMPPLLVILASTTGLFLGVTLIIKVMIPFQEWRDQQLLKLKKRLRL